MERTQIADYVQLMNRPFSLAWRNLLGGLSRGVGIAFGFTVFATFILYFLQLLGALNLPIIGDFIADIVRIVQHQSEKKNVLTEAVSGCDGSSAPIDASPSPARARLRLAPNICRTRHCGRHNGDYR